jgi:hypothetical protein
MQKRCTKSLKSTTQTRKGKAMGWHARASKLKSKQDSCLTVMDECRRGGIVRDRLTPLERQRVIQKFYPDYGVNGNYNNNQQLMLREKATGGTNKPQKI